MHRLFFLFFIITLVGCGGNNSGEGTDIGDSHIGNWISACYAMEGVDAWLTTEYQFSVDSVFQINRFYMDDKCTVISDDSSLGTPTKVEGHYDFVKRVSTVTGEEVNVYNFVFYYPVVSDETSQIQEFGLYIKNNTLYFVVELQKGEYRVSIEYPFIKINP